MNHDCSLSGLKILLVDDTTVNCMIAEKLIMRFGGSVVTVHNGRKALELFTASAPGEFSVILMDIIMPVMDGFQTTAAIRSSGHPDAATVPIIAVTSESKDEDKLHCFDCGMNSHLCKPYDPPALITLILDSVNGHVAAADNNRA